MFSFAPRSRDAYGRGQKLTPAGASVLGYFRGLRGSIGSLTRELAELQLGSSGRVSVGSIMALSPTLLTQAIIALKKPIRCCRWM